MNNRHHNQSKSRQIVGKGLKTLEITPFLILLLVTIAYNTISANTITNVPTILFLKSGASIQGKVLSLSPESVTVQTGKGDLLIPLRSLEDMSKKELEANMAQEAKKTSTAAPKDKSKLVSKILEEKEIQDQENEGSAPRIRFGRKDFVYRKYTHRGSEIDYIFTPVGQSQVYDSEETLRLTYHESISNTVEARNTITELISTLGGDIQVIPNMPKATSQGGAAPIEFVGTINGEGGNPSRVIFGRTFNTGNKFTTILYTKFEKEKTPQETKAWLGRNFERLQVVLKGVNTLPEEELLLPKETKGVEDRPEDKPEEGLTSDEI